MAHRWYAEPRFHENGRNPIVRFDKDNGLDLSGWFFSPNDPLRDNLAAGAKPTEREAVAAVFKYILDTHTDRNAFLDEEDGDFVEVHGLGGLDYEIPVDIVMNFTRNR